MELRCNCEKVSYPSKAAAQSAVHGIWDDDKIKMTYYKCPENNGYHLTTVSTGKSLRYIPHGLQGIAISLNKISKRKR